MSVGLLTRTFAPRTTMTISPAQVMRRLEDWIASDRALGA